MFWENTKSFLGCVASSLESFASPWTCELKYPKGHRSQAPSSATWGLHSALVVQLCSRAVPHENLSPGSFQPCQGGLLSFWVSSSNSVPSFHFSLPHFTLLSTGRTHTLVSHFASYNQCTPQSWPLKSALPLDLARSVQAWSWPPPLGLVWYEMLFSLKQDFFFPASCCLLISILFISKIPFLTLFLLQVIKKGGKHCLTT